MTDLSLDAALQPPPALGSERPSAVFVRTFGENRGGLAGVVVLAILAAACWLGPLFYNAKPNAVDTTHILAAPTSAHALGTDALGRDVLSRLFVGGQVSLSVGLAAALMATLLGIVTGVAAALYGGAVDATLMRFVDVLMSIPPLFFVIVLAVMFHPTMWLLVVVIGMTAWLVPARIVRAEAMSILAQPYCEVARRTGVSPWRVAWRHVLPNSIGTITVTLTFQVAQAILLVAGLSFLGFGIPPPTPSWGSMLTDAQTYVFQNAWWLIYPPGLAIVVTVIAVNMVGDALRDAFEVRLQRR